MRQEEGQCCQMWEGLVSLEQKQTGCFSSRNSLANLGGHLSEPIRMSVTDTP